VILLVVLWYVYVAEHFSSVASSLFQTQIFAVIVHVPTYQQPLQLFALALLPSEAERSAVVVLWTDELYVNVPPQLAAEPADM
jgi:hypothetical protein